RNVTGVADLPSELHRLAERHFARHTRAIIHALLGNRDTGMDDSNERATIASCGPRHIRNIGALETSPFRGGQEVDLPWIARENHRPAVRKRCRQLSWRPDRKRSVDVGVANNIIRVIRQAWIACSSVAVMDLTDGYELVGAVALLDDLTTGAVGFSHPTPGVTEGPIPYKTRPLHDADIDGVDSDCITDPSERSAAQTRRQVLYRDAAAYRRCTSLVAILCLCPLG